MIGGRCSFDHRYYENRRIFSNLNDSFPPKEIPATRRKQTRNRNVITTRRPPRLPKRDIGFAYEIVRTGMDVAPDVSESVHVNRRFEL